MGFWAERRAKSSEWQFTKEGQMTTKHGERTIASSQTDPRREAIAHQAGNKDEEGGDPALAAAWGKGAGERAGSACSGGSCVPSGPSPTSKDAGVGELSTGVPGGVIHPLNQHFWCTAVCVNSTQGSDTRGPEFQWGARETARVRRAMKMKMGLEEWDLTWLG